MNELEKLITVLNKAGMINNAEEKLLPEEIADLLWLMLYMQHKQEDQVGENASQHQRMHQPSLPLDLARQPPNWEGFSITAPDTLDDTVKLHLRGSNSPVAPQMGERRGLQVRSPAAPALPHTLKIARALRPLMRRTPSYTRFQLDEKATTHLIAETQGSIWTPVMKPASTRWLEIALVVDVGASMAPWHQTIDELRILLEHQGAFRDVRVWRLATDTAEHVSLYAGTNITAQQERNPKELIDPTNRRLILLVTDCVSPAWHSGRVQQVLDIWGKHNIVTLLHVFPRRMWTHTALSEADIIDVRVTHLARGNAGIEVAREQREQTEFVKEMAEQGFSIKASLPVPIITLEPETIDNWAHMINGTENTWILGAIFYQDLPPLPESLSPQQDRAPSARELVKQFRYMASQTAYDLLRYLSVAPISLPVIRLVQQTMFPLARQEHIAEVFLSGLFKEISRDETTNNHDYVEYDFLPGVRDALRETLDISDEFRIIETISQYLGDRYGHLRDFYALADSASPAHKDTYSIRQESRVFARIVSAAWRRMGGIHTVWADNLEQPIFDDQLVPIAASQNSGITTPQSIKDEISKSETLDRSIASPPGITLWRSLGEHKSIVKAINWSPDGKLLAAGTNDGTVWIWDAEQRKLLHILKGHASTVVAVEWSPNGERLTSRSSNGTIRVWDTKKGNSLDRLKSTVDEAYLELWSPDEQLLAISSSSGKIRIWKRKRAELLYILEGQAGRITAINWSPDSRLLASGAEDGTVRVWDISKGKLLRILEGQVGEIRSVGWSSDGKLLACNAIIRNQPSTNSVNIWRTDSWGSVTKLSHLQGEAPIVWHPHDPLMATVGQQPDEILIWKLDIELLLGKPPSSEEIHYANAKVVLVGDSGVGKSGLALVLTGQPFVPTESTHSRHVWLFDQEEMHEKDGPYETREVWLWDLAGQRDYQLIHQLHLHEATVAIIVFDATSENDPFHDIRNWQRALQLAQQDYSSSVLPLTILLVAARIDRGGKNISQERIGRLCEELGIAQYIETSAKDGRGIAALRQIIRASIDWTKLPSVTSTKLLYSIKSFLLAEQQAGRLLRPADYLYEAFLHTQGAPASSSELRQQFTIVLGQLVAQGVIRPLGFGNLILLQPERLDAYASALLIAVKEEPDELGSIAEARVQQGLFSVPAEERLPEQSQEKLLLIAMIDELVRHELALRESGFLLFPSQSTREHPDYKILAKKQTVIFSFTGPVLSLYTTLAVRLAQSGIFHKQGLWRYIVTYTTQLDVSGTYGLLLSPEGGEQAELGIFFDGHTSEDMRFLFEDFVFTHLEKRTNETVQRRRNFICSTCGEIFTADQVSRRRTRGFTSITCSICNTEVSLLDGAERLSRFTAQVREMEQTADDQRNRESAELILQGKRATQDFDVLLYYNRQDMAVVKQIGQQLMNYGILPWIDEWEVHPGLPWQQALEQQIGKIKTVAVFVGKNGLGPWQHQQLDALLHEFMQRGGRVIPVILRDVSQQPDLPVFLRGLTWVDFRVEDPDPMQSLLWGITGKQEIESVP